MEELQKFLFPAPGNVDDIAILEIDLAAVAADEFADIAEVDKMAVVHAEEAIGQQDIFEIL
jgi:hypothetical protein